MLPMGRKFLAGAIAAVGSLAVSATAATPAAAGPATVTVQPGDTLSTIAVLLHTSVAALMAANHLGDANRVLAGRVLVVPGSPRAPGSAAPSGPGSPPLTITVRRGDTLSALASRYHTTVGALAAANHLANADRVLAGSRLVVPGGTPAMALASYVVPGARAHASGLPSALVAHPARLGLRPAFASAAAAYGVPVAVLEALCWWESGWQGAIVSSTGAVGVCQIEPSTARLVNRSLGRSLNPAVPAQNIALGAAYLASLLRATGGNVGLALAGYYQGLSSVRASGMFPSTRTYVRGIEAYASIFAASG